MEWSNNNKFNSFNSWKGLLYAPWYEAIARGEFLPPIEASLDPIHACNLHCQHCNAHRYLEGQRMTDDHLLALVAFLGSWGVKAVCFGGGGEPTLHTRLHDAIVETRLSGMQASIATNGVLLRGKMLDIVPQCRWIGVSVDAGTRETYERLKGVDEFETVVGNLTRASKHADGCDISYKFLISSINQHEIFDACKLARDIGVRDFHARPMDFHHQGMGDDLDGKLAGVDLDLIHDQMEKCHELETDSFRVFTVMHKFNPDLTPVKNFAQCYGAPLVIQLCANGKVYFCVDQRHNDDYLLGSHVPDAEQILEFWGGTHHKALTFGDTPAQCKTRCTFGQWCKQCEELFVNDNDPMCWRFP